MKTPAACVATLLSILLATGCASTADAPPARPSQGDPVPLVFVSAGVPVVDALVNGRPARFLLDTGASVCILSPRLAQSLRLAPSGRRDSFVDAAGRSSQSGGNVRLDSLVLGTTDFGSVGAVIFDSPIFHGTGIDGAIGLNVFAGRLLTIDYARHRVTVSDGSLPAPDGRDILALTLGPGGGFAFPVRVAGVASSVELDTGASGALILPIEPGRFPGVGPSVPYTFTQTWSDSIGIRAAYLTGDLSIGRHVIRRPAALLANRRPGALFGSELLEYFVITLDIANRRIRFEREGSEPIEPHPHILPGVEVDGSTGLIVRASGSMLREGDRIISVAGEPFEQIMARRAMPVWMTRGGVIEIERDGRSFAVPIAPIAPR
jgi:predicted aspartyl protease